MSVVLLSSVDEPVGALVVLEVSITNLFDYWERAFLNVAVGGGGAIFSPPDTMYIGLSRTSPSDDGTGITEPSDGSYVRAVVANTTASWGPPLLSGMGTKSNIITIAFAPATDDWVSGSPLTFAVVFDAQAPGGNGLAYGRLGVPKSVFLGDQVIFSIGTFVWAFD